MSQFMALTFAVKDDSVDDVQRLFAESERPDHAVVDDQGNVVGALLQTLVFMKGATVVRVIEFDGEFIDVARHMSRQDEVRALESALDEHLVAPRDMITPIGAATFFANASMQCVISRKAGE